MSKKVFAFISFLGIYILFMTCCQFDQDNPGSPDQPSPEPTPATYYELTVQSGEGGSILLPLENPLDVLHGSSTLISAQPGDGYNFAM